MTLPFLSVFLYLFKDISLNNIKIFVCSYNSEPLSDGTCVFCSSSSVEDEEHFLLDCQIYDDTRKIDFDRFIMITQIIMIQVICSKC